MKNEHANCRTVEDNPQVGRRWKLCAFVWSGIQDAQVVLIDLNVFGTLHIEEILIDVLRPWRG